MDHVSRVSWDLGFQSICKKEISDTEVVWYRLDRVYLEDVSGAVIGRDGGDRASIIVCDRQDQYLITVCKYAGRTSSTDRHGIRDDGGMRRIGRLGMMDDGSDRARD